MYFLQKASKADSLEQRQSRYAQHKPKKSKKLAKDDLYQEITQKTIPFLIKNQFDIYPQTNTLEPHDYQLKPQVKFERPYFSPNYNS
ncbi:MAG: hypothetical protein EZS28_002664 [Streblomastix strix]|uniref:Uncharacterized protein n=1 Tax=Streblomastix strix TaxID=222440 RepID=A0A5J4X593_9EUKA|nr:MAG: hypothetical protein EZS28_002664 [Streblomastix strix]